MHNVAKTMLASQRRQNREGGGEATGALAPLIVKFRGLIAPKIVPCVPLLRVRNLIIHVDVIKSNGKIMVIAFFLPRKNQDDLSTSCSAATVASSYSFAPLHTLV